MKGRRPKPVFIIGCPRSGTTWLYHLLLSSGSFAIYRSETQFYNRFGPQFGDFANKTDRRAFLDSWLKSEFFLRSGLDADSFREVALNDVSSPGSMLNEFMNRICDEQSAKRWAECTPDHGLYIRRIKRDFPDALFLHVVRDGRDVTLSLTKQGFIKPFAWHMDEPKLASAAYWAWITNAISKQTDYLGNDLLTVFYEDLVKDLDSTLNRVANFIDKPIDPVRIKNNPVGNVVKPNSSFGQDVPGFNEQLIPRWQKYCDAHTLSRIENVLSHRLESLGYKPSTKPSGLLSHIRSTVLRLPYILRFRTTHHLRQLAIFGRFTSNDFHDAPNSSDSQDPTMRPQDNPAFIRRLVGSW